MAKLDGAIDSSGTEAPWDGSRRKAYSYLRFSTPEQRKGDSFRRQTNMAQEYARQHNLDLDETLTFHDEGVSGFRGQNAGAGRLADFREAVRVGLVPQGSVLLVEQLDRLSRMVPRRAMRVLEDIVDAGVSVVTLNDGREYSPASIDTDHTDLLISLLTFIRANEESETKSRRLKQSWSAKRANISLRPLTSKAPAWLQLNRETGRFEPIQERAATVERIFSMTLHGIGQHKIAEILNAEHIRPWGRGKHWQRSYIKKVLTNPAVVGTIVPHTIEHSGTKKLRVPQKAVSDYYPAVISQQTWTDVQALQAVHRATSKGAPISNILAGLATCPKCESTMTRVQKGKKSLPSFVCTRAKAGAGCEYKSVRYQWVEDRLLRILPHLIRDREGLEEIEEVEDRIAILRDAIQECREQIEEAVDALLELRSPALAERLRSLENELPGMQAELVALEGHREVMAGPLVGSRIEKAIATLQAPESGELDKAAVNVALRSLFRRAVINWPEGTVDMDWKAGGTCRVHYSLNPSINASGPSSNGDS